MGFTGMEKFGGGLADEYGDRVLVLRPRDSDIGCPGLRALQRGFGFNHRDLVVDAGFIERTGQIVRFSGPPQRSRRKFFAVRPGRESRRNTPPGWPARSDARSRDRPR